MKILGQSSLGTFQIIANGTTKTQKGNNVLNTELPVVQLQAYGVYRIVSSFYFNVLGHLLLKKQHLVRITTYVTVIDDFSPRFSIKRNRDVVRIVTEEKKHLAQSTV